MDNDDPIGAQTPAPPRAGRGRWVAAIVLLAAIAGGVVFWRQWSAAQIGPETADDPLAPAELDRRLLAAEQAVIRLRSGQEAQAQRLSDNRSRTSLLREELFALNQRAGLLEEQQQRLSEAESNGRMAARLDEAELLLGLSQARLRVLGDLPGAIVAAELADGALASLSGSDAINLRQSLAQELAALRAMPADPAVRAAGELDALEASLPQLAGAPRATPARPRQGDAWERLLDGLVQVRPAGEQDRLAPDDRAAAQAALEMEIALARLALARRDALAWRKSVERIDRWLQRLYADSTLRRQWRARLAALARQELKIEIPVAGSTLQQLRSLQRRQAATP